MKFSNNLIIIVLTIIFAASCQPEPVYPVTNCHPLAIQEEYVYECGSAESGYQQCTGTSCYFSSAVFYASSSTKTGHSSEWIRIEVDINGQSGEVQKVLYPDAEPICEDTGTYAVQLNGEWVRWTATMLFEDNTYLIISDSIIANPDTKCIPIDLTR